MDNRPIGVFDSGLGGLTGVRELRKRLPHEEIIYFGDTGRVPYGSRSPETILQYARQDVAFLLSKNVKCIMAACGTVSSTYPAAEAAKLPVPYLGVVDAAAREAAFATRNRRIGVIGTAATIRSRSYEKLLRQLVPGVEITAQACPLFVPLVEAGYVDHSEESRQQVTKLVIAQYLTEVREAGVPPVHSETVPAMVRRFSRSGVACGAKDAGTVCAAGMAVSVFGTSSPRTSSSSVTSKSSESLKSLSSSGIEASVSHLDTLWREMSNASARSPCDQFFCVRRRTMFSPSVINSGSPLRIFCVQFTKRHAKSPPSGVEKLATSGCVLSKGL